MDIFLNSINFMTRSVFIQISFYIGKLYFNTSKPLKSYNEAGHFLALALKEGGVGN